MFLPSWWVPGGNPTPLSVLLLSMCQLTELIWAFFLIHKLSHFTPPSPQDAYPRAVLIVGNTDRFEDKKAGKYHKCFIRCWGGGIWFAISYDYYVVLYHASFSSEPSQY